MAIALVGSAGAVTVGGSIDTLTLAFGQATTAGHLLVACVEWANGSAGVSAPSGWNVAIQNAGPVIYYKENCGTSETNPTFTLSGGGIATGVLTEFSGVATSSSLDKTGTSPNPVTSNPCVPVASAADTGNSELAIACFALSGTKTATTTFANAWSPASGTAGSIGNSGATSGTLWLNAAYYLLNTHGGGSADQDSCTATLSKGVVSVYVGCIATFKAAVIARPNNVTSQAVNRAGTY